MYSCSNMHMEKCLQLLVTSLKHNVLFKCNVLVRRASISLSENCHSKMQ